MKASPDVLASTASTPAVRTAEEVPSPPNAAPLATRLRSRQDTPSESPTRAGSASGSANTKRQALLVVRGSFSHINAQFRSALQAQRPDLDVVTFDVEQAIRRDYPALLRCLRGAVSEYGLSTLGSRKLLKYRLLRSRAYYREVRRALEVRFGNETFAFTLQTQSLFNAKLPGSPHYVYTDHVARARYAVGENEVGSPSDDWLALEQGIYDSATHVFTFGPTIRRLLIESYGTPPAKVSAIGAGASVVPNRPADTTLRRYSKRRILFVGVEWERKGGPELIAAFADLRKHLPDTTLTIIGCTPDVTIKGCRVLGRLPPEEVEQHFHESSCFCMPSRLEPFGIVFTEAMQFGLPIVATSVGDIGAIVREGDTGLLVPAGNSTALALALRQVLESAERCRDFGLRSLARAESFTWAAVVRRLTAHLKGAPADAAAIGAIW